LRVGRKANCRRKLPVNYGEKKGKKDVRYADWGERGEKKEIRQREGLRFIWEKGRCGIMGGKRRKRIWWEEEKGPALEIEKKKK